MRIHTADWHLHPFKSYATLTEEGLNSRLAEQITAIAGMIEWGEQHGASHLIFSGDATHSLNENIGKMVIRAAYVLFEKAKKAGMQNIIVPGNHDIYHGKTIFRSFQDVAQVIVEPTSMRIDNDVFTFIPFQRPPSRFIEKLAEQMKKIDWDAPRIKFLVCHQMFSGAQIGPSEYKFKLKHAIDPEEVKLYDHVISGHCHRSQEIGNIIYTGSPLQHDHGDEGNERGFWFWDGHGMLFMPINGPRFHTYHIESMEDYKHFIEDYVESDYYQIVVKGELEIELPHSRRVSIHKKWTAPVRVRVDVQRKTAEDIIKGVLDAGGMPADLDKEAVLKKAMEVWEEVDEG